MGVGVIGCDPAVVEAAHEEALFVEKVAADMPGSVVETWLKGDARVPVYTTGPDGRPEMIWRP